MLSRFKAPFRKDSFFISLVSKSGRTEITHDNSDDGSKTFLRSELQMDYRIPEIRLDGFDRWLSDEMGGFDRRGMETI